MRSMTAYGAGIRDTAGCRVSARLRSVNHRYLDVAVRLPEEMRHLEVGLRQRLAQDLSRGRVELRVEVDDRREKSIEVVFDRTWVQAIQAATQALSEEGLEVGELRLTDLLRIPEALRVVRGSAAPDTDLEQWVSEAVDGAVEELIGARDLEGDKLGEAVGALVGQLSVVAEELATLQGAVREELQEKLQSRLQELVAGGSAVPDESRVAQEIALLIDRSDVREELDRLRAHCEHFVETMAESGPVGKKLDFLAQEMAREINTLGAKSRSTGIGPLHLEAKLICEQIREQVQNIE